MLKWSTKIRIELKLLFNCFLDIPEKNDVQLSKGEERWVWPRDALNNSGKKIDSSKKNTKLKVNILKRKYWYEEPKPLKFCE